MGASQARAELDERPARRAALLHELGAEYPDIGAKELADVLDRAFLAARLGTGGESVRMRFVMVVARDRLDLLRTRRAAQSDAARY